MQGHIVHFNPRQPRPNENVNRFFVYEENPRKPGIKVQTGWIVFDKKWDYVPFLSVISNAAHTELREIIDAKISRLNAGHENLTMNEVFKHGSGVISKGKAVWAK